jgi:hypothetical protein
MTRPSAGLLFVLLGLLLGAGPTRAGGEKKGLPAPVKAILEKAKTVELYSLEPEPTEKQRAGKPEKLHGWLVLGKTAVKDAKTRKGLLDGLLKNPGRGAKCFDPRHAIRATHDGKTVDLLVCFACGWVYVYEGDKHTTTLTVAKGVQPTFDKVLKAAGVPLARAR